MSGSPQRDDTSTPVDVARRSRASCQQCRRRKRKCDERHPRCAGCVERGLPCDWRRDEPRRQQIARRHHQYNRDYTIPRELRPFITVFMVPSMPVQQRLLSYFCENSPLWLTAGGIKDKGACVGVIMPVALQSPLVLSCVLALAAGDLSKYQSASSDMANLTDGFYSQAVVGIHAALNNVHSTSGCVEPSVHTGDDILLAVILLCVHETVNFTETSRILPHINAAASLFYNYCFDTAQDTRLRGLLLEIFYYIFALSAFSHGRKLHLRLAMQVFNSTLLSDPCYRGVLLGWRCRQIVSFILRVAMLTSGTTSVLTADETPASELKSIEAQLEQFPTPQFEPGDTARADEEAASELYRLACLIHVRKTLYPGLADRSAAIQDLVSQFITNLNMISPSSPTNNILCWPLFVAGMSSVVATHRRVIIGRLRKNHETWRSNILTKSADFLSRKWREDKVSEHLRSPGEEACYIEAPSRTSTVGQEIEFPVVLL